MRGRKSQRYLVTVLFTDIVGSTELAAELGDEGWRELLQAHHEAVRQLLRRHDGQEVDTAGDGFFAVFDAPAAAVDCALAIAEHVRELGIEIRGAVHVGEVERMGRKVAGITVPIAARILMAAGPGEVLVSATVRDLAAGAGLRFEDRGARELKGVPGVWHVYAATRELPAPGAMSKSASPLGPAERRAAAVRSVRARPIWRRRPRFVAAALGSTSIGLLFVGLFLMRPWEPPALPRIAEDAVGVIDVARGAIVASIPAGRRPGAIALAEDVAWVTATGSDLVSRIDLSSRQVTREIDVGRAPVAVARAGGSIWVANSGERTVTRINEETARTVDRIEVGNRPAAIAADAHGVWVANAGDSTLVRIDPVTGSTDEPIPVPAGPAAIAVDDTGVWVASTGTAAVTHVDPDSGVIQAAPIVLAARPTAVATGGGAVWVTGEDGTLIRINPETARLTQTADVGGTPVGLAVDDGVVWIADANGFVVRFDPARPTAATSRVPTVASPAAIASTGSALLVAGRAEPGSHRGGTLRVLFPWFDAIDPLQVSPYNAAYLQADGLVGYRRVGGSAGAELLPALAIAVPAPAEGGRRWTFQLRPDLYYPDGQPVLASDFRRAFERSFQVAPEPFGVIGPVLWPSLVGAERCTTAAGPPVERCDLSEGVVTDDAARTVTFHLDEPDGDFLAKLALPPAFPVPDGVPMDDVVAGAFPGTGPYTLTTATETQSRFVRNPRFRVHDERVRPDGMVDEILLTSLGLDVPHEERVRMILEGEADYTPLRGPERPSPDVLRDLSRGHPVQMHFGPTHLTYVYMDLSKPPFDDRGVRQALNIALDRGRLVEDQGGSPVAAVTCQALPPGWPGHRPYCPYTDAPDAGGGWHSPDIETGRQLVERSGTRGMTVHVGPVREAHLSVQAELVRALEGLGYDVSVEPVTDTTGVFEALDAGRMQLGVFDWAQGILAPSTFFDEFRCGNESRVCEPSLDRLIEEAIELQSSDAAAAADKWSEADRALVDLAFWAPLYHSGADLVSRRVDNVQFHPAYLLLLDQLWVR